MTSIESNSQKGSNMNDNTSQQPFTPSLGLRWWMNKMKKTSDNNKNNSPTDSYPPQESRKSANDTLSTASISELTTATGGSSFFGISSHYGHEVDSSLRVLNPGGANSEISSIFSVDVQSNASIRSKPWVSKELYPNHINDHNDYYHDDDDDDEDDEDEGEDEEEHDHGTDKKENNNNNNDNDNDDDDDDGDKNNYKNNESTNENYHNNNNKNKQKEKYKSNIDNNKNDKNVNIKIEDFDLSHLADSHKTTESFATNQEYQPLYSINDQINNQSSIQDVKQQQWSENGNSTQRLAKIKAGLFFSRK